MGELAANPFGLFDVLGNVWEWMQDGWSATFFEPFAETPAVDPVSPPADNRRHMVRGGCFVFSEFLGRSASRRTQHVVARFGLFGFRVSLPVEAVRQALNVQGPENVKASPSSVSRPSSLDPHHSRHGWPADAPKPAIAPFDAEQAKKHQEEWAAYLKIPIENTNSIGMKFVVIPPGEFTMGSTPEEIEEAINPILPNQSRLAESIRSEGPQHKVILTQPIYLGVTEVTQAEYEKVMGSNPSYFAKTGTKKTFAEKVEGLDTSAHPVENVSWNDAAEFCARLSRQEKLKPFYLRTGETISSLDGTGYRLPSEAEWEFACRAGTTTKYWIGDKDEELMQAGWFGTNARGRTHASAELKANPFGLFDIHGNVWEWVQDAWEPAYYSQFQEKSALNPIGPSSARSQCVVRGGNWSNAAFDCRSSYRYAYGPSATFINLGFRVSLLAVDPRVSR